MMIGAIRGSNVVLKGGENVQDLPAIRGEFHGVRGYASAWLPTPEELAALNAGASVILFVFSTMHPPVYVGVSEP